MGKIFYVMGKSSSGKDTVYEALLRRKELKLHKIVLYTTRPIRAGETDGLQYHFVKEEKLQELLTEGKVIELRRYDTVCGVWKYFTVDDENMDLKEKDYLAIGTLESCKQLKDYYGEEVIVPLYIEVEDGIRLERALNRERKQENPNYEELCRRFLADTSDFSKENLEKAKILKCYIGNKHVMYQIKTKSGKQGWFYTDNKVTVINNKLFEEIVYAG